MLLFLIKTNNTFIELNGMEWTEWNELNRWMNEQTEWMNKRMNEWMKINQNQNTYGENWNEAKLLILYILF